MEDGIQCVNIYDAGFQIDYPLFCGGNPFTISFWGKDSSANSEVESIDMIFQGDSSGYGRMNITYLSGKFKISNLKDWTSSPTVTSDSFHHYVVTYDQKYHLFTDNLPVAESSYEFNLNLPRNPTMIFSPGFSPPRRLHSCTVSFRIGKSIDLPEMQANGGKKAFHAAERRRNNGS